MLLEGRIETIKRFFIWLWFRYGEMHRLLNQQQLSNLHKNDALLQKTLLKRNFPNHPHSALERDLYESPASPIFARNFQ